MATSESNSRETRAPRTASQSLAPLKSAKWMDRLNRKKRNPKTVRPKSVYRSFRELDCMRRQPTGAKRKRQGMLSHPGPDPRSLETQWVLVGFLRLVYASGDK